MTSTQTPVTHYLHQDGGVLCAEHYAQRVDNGIDGGITPAHWRALRGDDPLSTPAACEDCTPPVCRCIYCDVVVAHPSIVCDACFPKYRRADGNAAGDLVDPYEADFMAVVNYYVARTPAGAWNVYRVRQGRVAGELVDIHDLRGSFAHRIQAVDYVNGR